MKYFKPILRCMGLVGGALDGICLSIIGPTGPFSTRVGSQIARCVQFESQHCGGTWYGETHKWRTDTANIFTNLPSSSKAGFETVHKYAMDMLWMSLLTIQHPTFFD